MFLDSACKLDLVLKWVAFCYLFSTCFCGGNTNVSYLFITMYCGFQIVIYYFFYISKTVTVLWNHVCNILLILTCDVSEGSLTQMCWGSPRGFCLYNSSVFILLGRNSELKQTWYKYLLSNLSWKDWATLLNGSTNHLSKHVFTKYTDRESRSGKTSVLKWKHEHPLVVQNPMRGRPSVWVYVFGRCDSSPKIKPKRLYRLFFSQLLFFCA